MADRQRLAGTPSTGSFGGTHIYADDGTYTVTVMIHDDDGGIDTHDSRSWSKVTSFVPPPNGIRSRSRATMSLRRASRTFA